MSLPCFEIMGTHTAHGAHFARSRRAMGKDKSTRSHHRKSPDDWGYNPSSWGQRLPIVGLGFVGMCIALYLAAYQLGWTTAVWDPVFGGGSERVLESRLSRLFPVSDALLGAIGYAVDWIFGLVGGQDRYRRKPWAVIIFGIGIIPFGWTSIALGMAMPTMVGAGCLLCFVNTAISIAMIPPSWDEVWASLLAIRGMVQDGASVWDAVLGRAV